MAGTPLWVDAGAGRHHWGCPHASHFPFCCWQIAPAEGPDASERMVIITGPPEAQFKVSAMQALVERGVHDLWLCTVYPRAQIFTGLEKPGKTAQMLSLALKTLGQPLPWQLALEAVRGGETPTAWEIRDLSPRLWQACAPTARLAVVPKLDGLKPA